MTPLTHSGKLFTIIYSILGIPFTGVFLTVAVQRLLAPTCATLVFFFSRLGSSVNPFTIRSQIAKSPALSHAGKTIGQVTRPTKAQRAFKSKG